MQTLVAIGRTADLIDAIRSARHVELDAYVLSNPLVLFTLERAATRGTSVSVRLGDPDPKLRGGNLSAMNRLQAAGAHVEIAPGYGPESMHDKIAIVDGVTYRDDRNFTTDQTETIVIDARPPHKQHYADTKRDALDAEAALIEKARGHDLLVSTEALGDGIVVDALLRRAAAGDRVRLMYDSSTACPDAVLEKLRAAGVQIRRSEDNHKAAVASDAAWIGSANATPAAPSMHDWGTVLRGPAVASLRETLEFCWSRAKPLADAAHSPVHRDSGA